MIYAFTGLLFGILIGLNIKFQIPIEFIKYTAVVILAIVDSIFGSIKAEVSGIASKDQYSALIFSTGLITNTLAALGITLLGEYLGLDLYLAATVVFTFRIIRNIGKIRRILIENYINKKKGITIEITTDF